jgi:hypothetical protein
MNILIILLSFLYSTENNQIKNNYVNPIVFENKFIMLVEPSCQDIVMINMGPSYISKNPYLPYSLITDYSPWKKIVTKIQNKYNFEIVNEVNKTNWITNNFLCNKIQLNYPKYIGVNGWNLITGIGTNISNKIGEIENINIDGNYEFTYYNSIIIVLMAFIIYFYIG